MNWKWGIAFGVLVFITLVSIVYAFVQQTEAERQRRIADLNANEAQRQRALAEATMAEAEKQRMAAETFRLQLEQCQKKK